VAMRWRWPASAEQRRPTRRGRARARPLGSRAPTAPCSCPHRSTSGSTGVNVPTASGRTCGPRIAW
jgi:hypothetical protein